MALAEEFQLALTEVFETATFYHHFDVLEDGGALPGNHNPGMQFHHLRNVWCKGTDIGTEKQPGRRCQDTNRTCMGACDQAPAPSVKTRSYMPRSTAFKVRLRQNVKAVIPVTLITLHTS